MHEQNIVYIFFPFFLRVRTGATNSNALGLTIILSVTKQVVINFQGQLFKGPLLCIQHVSVHLFASTNSLG